MGNNQRERGEGRLGCLVGVVFLLLAGLVAYRLIPVKVRAAELRDTMIDEAKSAGQHTDKQITQAILAKAKQLELPLDDDAIKIRRSASNIHIELRYTVPVEFPGYTYNMDFDESYENPVF